MVLVRQPGAREVVQHPPAALAQQQEIARLQGDEQPLAFRPRFSGALTARQRFELLM